MSLHFIRFMNMNIAALLIVIHCYLETVGCLCDDQQSTTSSPTIKLAINQTQKELGQKGIEMFFKYCGNATISDSVMEQAEKCHHENSLDQETVKTCSQEVWEGISWTERRRIRCHKRSRNERQKMFMVCYIRENPEDAGNQKERYDRFQAMSRSDKQKILQNAFYHYLACVAKAADSD